MSLFSIFPMFRAHCVLESVFISGSSCVVQDLFFTFFQKDVLY